MTWRPWRRRSSAALRRPGPAVPAAQPGSRLRVLTLSRELGAGEQGFAPTLGERLGMQVYDRELLEQEAVRLGVPEAELEKIDERGAGIFQRFRPGSIYQRYFEALGQLMHELAGPASGRPAARSSSAAAAAASCAMTRVLFTSASWRPLPVRVRRVMEYRWVREGISKKLIAESDARRSNFYESYFGADWSSPLEYDVTVNSGRLGLAAIEAVATAAEKHWSRTRIVAGRDKDRRINNCPIVAFRSAKAASFAERKATLISTAVLRPDLPKHFGTTSWS